MVSGCMYRLALGMSTKITSSNAARASRLNFNMEERLCLSVSATSTV